jgi:hypothetical protein
VAEIDVDRDVEREVLRVVLRGVGGAEAAGATAEELFLTEAAGIFFSLGLGVDATFLPPLRLYFFFVVLFTLFSLTG